MRLGTNLNPALFDQNRAELDGTASLWDTLTGDASLGVSGRNDQVMVRGKPRHVVGYLKEFLFAEAQARGPVSALSGGEKARLLLARLMARDSNLLILDEPTNDLDVETLDLLQELVDDYDGTVLLVSHDRDFVDRDRDHHRSRWRATAGREIYAGGWTDYRSQRQDAAAPPPPLAPKPARRAGRHVPPGRAARREAELHPDPPAREAARPRSSASPPTSPGSRRCSPIPTSTPATRALRQGDRRIVGSPARARRRRGGMARPRIPARSRRLNRPRQKLNQIATPTPVVRSSVNSCVTLGTTHSRSRTS